jgi:ABC-type branched-subunit amino acid transport system substrate-binding protein
MHLPDPQRSRAILIGTSRYRTAAGLTNLPAVRRNLVALEEVLTDPKVGVLRPECCVVMLDPEGPHAVGLRLADVADEARDVLVVYYAGHGLLDAKGELYLAVANTAGARLRYTGLPLQWVREAIQESPAPIRVLILDCCFSGRAIEAMTDVESVAAEQLKISGTYTLTSTTANALAQAPVGDRYTAFTGELVKLLRHGVPGVSEPLTLDALYRHLKTVLDERGLPRPQRRAVDGANDVVLSRAVHSTLGSGATERPEPVAVRKRPTVRQVAVGVVTAAVISVVGLAMVDDGTSPCSPSSVGSTSHAKAGDGVLSFGTLLPRTGSWGSVYDRLIAGVQLGVNDVIDSGGIPGIDVRLEATNQRDSGDATSDLACEAVSAGFLADVDAIIGPASSEVNLKVMDKATRAGVILFSPSSTSRVLSTYPDSGLYFRTAAPDLRGPVLGKLVVDDGNRTAVVISIDDSWGNPLRRETAKAIRDAGGRVLESFNYDQRTQNFDHQIKRVAELDPDAVVLIGLDETVQLLATMNQQGVGPQRKKVYGTANVNNTLARRVNSNDLSVLAGMKGVGFPVNNQAFLTRLREFNPSLQDSTYAAEAYDAVVITALAAEIANSDAPRKVAEKINGVTKGGEKCQSFAECKQLVQAGRDIDYDGAAGPLEFTDTGEPSVTSYVIQEIQPDGSLRVLRHEEIRERSVGSGHVAHQVH